MVKLLLAVAGLVIGWCPAGFNKRLARQPAASTIPVSAQSWRTTARLAAQGVGDIIKVNNANFFHRVGPS